jgi:LysM repeat protein
MSRSHLLRLGVIALMLVLLATLAPTVGAQTRNGNWYGWYYNGIQNPDNCMSPPAGAAWAGPELGDISWYWAEGTSPRPGLIGNENYTICWQGWYNFPNSGNYTFYAEHDDGIRIWLQGAPNSFIMDRWYDTGPVVDTSTKYVPAGTYEVVVAYYNHTNAGVACVGITTEGGANPLHCPYVPPSPAPAPVPVTIPGPYPSIIINNIITNVVGPYVPPSPRPAVAPACFWYRVQWGDRLYSIAWKFGTTVWRIQQDNRILNPNYIYAGQLLRICR